MTFSKVLTIGGVVGCWLMGQAFAASCTSVHEFEGLVFDAGTFPASHNMETLLDDALMNGVEKVVLFPHPNAKKDNNPKILEDIFPDLVLRGHKPWSKAEAVIWPEPMDRNAMGLLEVELDYYKTRKFLLGNVLRFNLNRLSRLVTTYPNLWLGFGAEEIDMLLKSCAKGPLMDLFNKVPGRVVYASYGLDLGWKKQKKTLRDLKNFAGLLSEEQADALVFGNAEDLYNLPVNAP